MPSLEDLNRIHAAHWKERTDHYLDNVDLYDIMHFWTEQCGLTNEEVGQMLQLVKKVQEGSNKVLGVESCCPWGEKPKVACEPHELCDVHWEEYWGTHSKSGDEYKYWDARRRHLIHQRRKQS